MDEIIKDFHDLKDIPAFQAMIEEPEYLQTADHLDVVQMNICLLYTSDAADE